MGKVNRDELESFYQNKGEFYDDEKTEGALGVLADTIDGNWEEFEERNTEVDGTIETIQTKLGTIQDGAEVNQNAFSKVKVAGQSDVDAGSKTDAFTLEGGTGISVTTDPATKKARITATGESVPAAHGEEHDIGGSDQIPGLVSLNNTVNTHLVDYASYKEYLRFTSLRGLRRLV